MLRFNDKSVLAFGVVASLACGACSEVKRQTVDRFDTYEKTTWTSPDDCESTLPDPDPQRAPRIASWNIRYFPDMVEESVYPDEGTNVDWLSCAITSLDVDVLAIQEFKRTPEAEDAQDDLLARLNDRTGGDWRLELSTCDPENVQHPGFLYDSTRITGNNFRELSELNPLGECSNDASPGFAGYFTIEGGPDFHLVSMHMASGDGETAIEARRDTFSKMADAATEAQSVVADDDVIFVGDLNTSGCTECAPAIESTEEIEEMISLFDESGNPLRALDADQECSREDGSNSHLLDHYVVADSMTEIPSGSVTRVGGFCAEGACERLREWQTDARETLTDHCPILLDLAATDDD